MAVYQFRTKQHVAASIDEVWDFISSPANLKKITPAHMGFEITSEGADAKMYSGMIITYKVSPLMGIKMDWMTEITHVKEKKYFVDEQRLGTYKMWHHQHHLIAEHDGVSMLDTVTYIPPFGFLGAIANKLIIQKKLKEIFDYRTLAVNKEFPKKNKSQEQK